MGFSRQEYWIGLPRPPPGDLPNAGIESVSLLSSALAGGFFTTSTIWDGAQESLLTTGSLDFCTQSGLGNRGLMGQDFGSVLFLFSC